MKTFKKHVHNIVEYFTSLLKIFDEDFLLYELKTLNTRDIAKNCFFTSLISAFIDVLLVLYISKEKLKELILNYGIGENLIMTILFWIFLTFLFLLVLVIKSFLEYKLNSLINKEEIFGRYLLRNQLFIFLLPFLFLLTYLNPIIFLIAYSILYNLFFILSTPKQIAKQKRYLGIVCVNVILSFIMVFSTIFFFVLISYIFR